MCAGAPIIDPRSGRVVGVVGLTALAGEGSALMLPLAARAAHEVEQRLVDESGVTQRLVLQRFLQERRRAKGPLVFVTEHTIITNAAADRLVAPDDEPALRGCAGAHVRGDRGRGATTLRLRSGTTVDVRCEPIIDDAAPAGTILRLEVVSETDPAAARSRRDAPTFGWDSLTETERSVTALVSQGLTNKEAADRLFLSRHTVGFHLRSIYRKLGIRSRVDLTRSVLEQEVGHDRVASALSGRHRVG
jgi:DNA-binding CsgD family transcriptional regulator